jgi:hypothetical protein
VFDPRTAHFREAVRKADSRLAAFLPGASESPVRRIRRGRVGGLGGRRVGEPLRGLTSPWPEPLSASAMAFGSPLRPYLLLPSLPRLRLEFGSKAMLCWDVGGGVG